jgi:protein-disulfide isomerase
MSKRQEIRARRRREAIRSRITVVVLVTIGALMIVLALIYSNRPASTQTATSDLPVVQVTPRTFNVPSQGTSLGDPNAPVKVDAYEDFRCSACLYYSQNFEPQIIQDYVDTGDVYYTYHFFIVIDGQDGSNASYQAANASMCAAEQGRFWDYHDTLYANQITEDAALFTDERLVTMAQNLGLDMSAFNQCFLADSYGSKIQSDLAEARALNLNGTPSIFVNGVQVQMDQVATAIQTALSGQQ